MPEVCSESQTRTEILDPKPPPVLPVPPEMDEPEATGLNARTLWIIAAVTGVSATLFTLFIVLPAQRGPSPTLLFAVWAVPLFAAVFALFAGRTPRSRGPARPPGYRAPTRGPTAGQAGSRKGKTERRDGKRSKKR